MKRDETAGDRLVHELLREDANAGSDEAFLTEVEQAILEEDKSAQRMERTGTKTKRWSWGLAAAACLSAGATFYFQQNDRDNEISHVRADQARESLPPTQSPATPAVSFPPSPAPEPGATQPGLPGDVESKELGTGIAATVVGRKKPVSPPEPSPLSLGNVIASNTPGPTRVPIPTILGDESLSRDSLDSIGRNIDYGSAWGDGKTRNGLRENDATSLRSREASIRGGFLIPDGEPAPPTDRERYGQLVDQPWKTPWQHPLSTFSADVDTASYTNIRRMLRDGTIIPRDAVRIEECINYFDYRYEAPKNGGPFAVHLDMASCPWNEAHHLVKIGLKGKEVNPNTRPPSNLVFLIDVSGSMQSSDKLPLLVESMKILVEELDERDSVGIVVYAGSAGTVLEPTKVVGNGRTEILSALDHLRAGGSTAGAAGIRGAYDLAAKHFLKEGVNRVILATDGDFNVGTSSNGALVDLVKERAKTGVFLSVLGFGTGNLNDSMMEAITNEGNGNYFYIDSQREGRKVFLQNLSGTLVTIAKDVKIQIEFNPAKVEAYRLIGYANRILPPEAFNDDKVDAGDIGAGHTVTALYEIVPKGVQAPPIGGVDPLKYQKPANRVAGDSPEWMTVKLRYKAPDGDKSTLIEIPLETEPTAWKLSSPDFQFAAGVALFGEKLRQSDKIGDADWNLVNELVRKGLKQDPHGHRAEFQELLARVGGLPAAPRVPAKPPAIEAPPAR